jgi:hypothetical protein
MKEASSSMPGQQEMLAEYAARLLATPAPFEKYAAVHMGVAVPGSGTAEGSGGAGAGGGGEEEDAEGGGGGGGGGSGGGSGGGVLETVVGGVVETRRRYAFGDAIVVNPGGEAYSMPMRTFTAKYDMTYGSSSGGGGGGGGGSSSSSDGGDGGSLRGGLPCSAAFLESVNASAAVAVGDAALLNQQQTTATTTDATSTTSTATTITGYRHDVPPEKGE